MNKPKYLEDAGISLSSDDPAMRDYAKETITKYLKYNHDAYIEYKEVLTDSEKVTMLNDEVQRVLREVVEEYEEMIGLLEEEINY